MLKALVLTVAVSGYQTVVAPNNAKERARGSNVTGNVRRKVRGAYTMPAIVEISLDFPVRL